MDWFVLSSILIVVCYFLYWYVQRNNDYFKKLGIPFIRPIPFFGNSAQNFFRQKHANNIMREFYNYDKNAKYIGIFEFTKPIFLIRDPELIKSVTIKVLIMHTIFQSSFRIDNKKKFFRSTLTVLKTASTS